MLSEYMAASSSILLIIFSAIFICQIRGLNKQSFVIGPNPLSLKMLSTIYRIYRNTASSFMALARLDDVHQVLPPQLKPLVRKLPLGFCIESTTSDSSLLNILLDNPAQDKWKIVDFLFKEAVRDLRKRLFTTNVRNIITLVLTGIILAPVIVMVSVFFHQKGTLELLPIMISLFYGIALQLIVVVLKRYASVLV